MKKILFFSLCLSIASFAAFAQNSPAFSQVFTSLGLTAKDVSLTVNEVQAADSFSFTIRQIPGYRLFIWMESRNTANNLLIKPCNNFSISENDISTVHLLFPVPGIWHAAVFFIPEGTSQLLNLFSFSITASAGITDEKARLIYRESTGKDPE